MNLQKIMLVIVCALFVSLCWLTRFWLVYETAHSYTYTNHRGYEKLSGLEKIENQFGTREWRAYLPEVDNLLNKIEQGIVKWPVDINFTTDPKSSVIILPSLKNLKVGDKLAGSIQARDFHGKAKTHGGDHFRARLVKMKDLGQMTKDGIAVMMKDNMNGTYAWNTIIPWPGRSKLIIELVHSSEAVVDMVLQTASQENKQRLFLAQLSNGAAVNCDIVLRDEPLACDYSRPENGITWTCKKMSVNSSCSEIVMRNKNPQKPDGRFENKKFFQENITWQVELKNSGQTFAVKGDIRDMSKSTEKCNLSTGMRSLIYPNYYRPSGFYYQGRWISLLCDNKHRDLKRVQNCLQNTSVYFIGDSTMRQWYFSRLRLALKVDGSASDVKGKYWSLPQNSFNKEYHIELHYRAHGDPLYNPGPPSSRPYVVDSLKSITGNSKTVVVLNIGAHFLLYDPSVIIQRSAGIKNALIDLHKRLPNVKIFLRGSIRYKETSQLCPTEWLYMRTDRILRWYFSDLPYVGYIDTWEMTTPLPQKNVHAGSETIDQFVSLFLSYTCPDI